MTESVISGIVSGVTTIEIQADSKPTSGQLRTAKARRTAARKAEERRAEWLIARGWTCTPPTDDATEE